MNFTVSEYLSRRTIDTRENKAEKAQCGQEIVNSIQREYVDSKINSSISFYTELWLKCNFSPWEHLSSKMCLTRVSTERNKINKIKTKDWSLIDTFK